MYGHKTICLIGTATTLIGDPTWKNHTRPMLDEELITHNANKILEQIARIFMPDHLVENRKWLDMSMLTFLREVGAYFSINQLINLDTFYNRLESKEHLSFLEISYPLLQAYDFLHLNLEYGCNVQVGGSDQWGNITQGIQYVKRITNKDVYGLVTELLVSSKGDKMGKTTNGAIFLDSELTSVYDFWQFWRNIDDNDVEDLLLKFTELTLREIKDLLEDCNNAKKYLADQITEMVHGKTEAINARTKSEAIFEHGNYDLLPEILVQEQITLDHVLYNIGASQSISEAKRIIQGGGVQIDGVKMLDPNHMLQNKIQIISYGKHKFFKVRKV
jgi:tyrosyl-tRNA synthetase